MEMRINTLFLAAAIMFASFLGAYTTRDKERRYGAEQFKAQYGLHVGGLDVKAPDGDRLLFHVTGDLWEMDNGEWKPLDICD